MGLKLEVRDLVIRRKGSRAILDVAHLEVAPGEALVVRGPSGAGKSTLLFALAGLIKPDEGSVRWDDTQLFDLSDPQRAAFRRDTLGMVFQDHLLFEELSSHGNAALASLYEPRRRRQKIRSNAAALLDHLGIEKSTRDVTRFSGGERQRIAMARALSGGPKVVLADEPTASLDRKAADRLIDDLFALADRQRTLIIVSHDPAIHARAGRLASVVDGKLRTAARV